MVTLLTLLLLALQPPSSQEPSRIFADSFETGDASCWSAKGCTEPKPLDPPPAPQINGPCPAGTTKVRRIEGAVPCSEGWTDKARVYEITGAYRCDGRRVETRERVAYTRPQWVHVCGTTAGGK